MASDELQRLLSALRELPPKCQHAFLLHRFQGLSTLEVAVRMDLTDREPPFVSSPIASVAVGYDPANASPLGRFVSLSATKKW